MSLPSLCAGEGCRRPLHLVTAWEHQGALFCSLGCVHGDCPSCGVSLRRVPSLWLVSVEGRREVFCSSACGAARTSEQRAKEAALAAGWERSRALLESLHALALLNAIALSFFSTDEQVSAHVAEHADVVFRGQTDPERTRRAWARAWEIDAVGGRSRALVRTRKLVAIVRAVARGAS